jgi:hypothetical protein
MTIKSKPLDLVNEADLQALVDNKVREIKTIEYKRSLPGNSDKEKRELLYDISSFANASGGDLIFGMTETDGVASEVSGLERGNIDQDILRLQNITRDGIEPRIPGLTIRALDVQATKAAIIVRIPRSFAMPHVVKYAGTFKFYSRNSAGKYPLDVAELRALFALSETTAERIRNFRTERLSKILADETPVPLIRNPRVVLHIVPVGAFDPAVRFDLSAIAEEISDTKPMGCGGWNQRYNFDGFLTYARGQGEAYSYLQIFTHGAIEALQASYLEPTGQERIIRSAAIETAMAKSLSRYIRTQEKLGVEAPLFVMLALLGVEGYRIGGSDRHWESDGHAIDRNDLIIPEVMVEDFNSDPHEVMRPIFDSIWNAAGWSRDMNYDDDGNWVKPQDE